MLSRLLSASLKRDARKKVIAFAAVALAVALATFLLNWSLNLGDKMQRELRAYGANIMVTPAADRLPFAAGEMEIGGEAGTVLLQVQDLEKLKTIFWRNQILALAPVLPVHVLYNPGAGSAGSDLLLVGTEFGQRDSRRDFRKVVPGLELTGHWPKGQGEAVAGSALAAEHQWKEGQQIRLEYAGAKQDFRITGIVRSGGAEDSEVLAPVKDVQRLTGNDGQFRQLLVSALVSPENELYQKNRRNPKSLTPDEYERFSCTPFITSVAADIQSALPGSEARVIQRVSETEQKVSRKVNWLMLLVTLAALVASALTTASTTTGMILERRKELALMKAIGSQNSFIAGYLVLEILLLGVVASLAGYFLGCLLSIGLGRLIFDSALDLKWIVLPWVTIIGSLVIVCGSLWPLRSAIKLQPSQLLKDL